MQNIVLEKINNWHKEKEQNNKQQVIVLTRAEIKLNIFASN